MVVVSFKNDRKGRRNRPAAPAGLLALAGLGGGAAQPGAAARNGPAEGGGASVYGPVLGTPATPEAVGGLGRRARILRTARAQQARGAPPCGRAAGVISLCYTIV